MRQKSGPPEKPPEKVVKEVRRATRKRHSPEEKIRIVLPLRGAGRLLAHSAWSRTADGSRLTVAWKLYIARRVGDVIDPLVPALKAAKLDILAVVNSPRLLSDDGSSYISGDLAEWLADRRMRRGGDGGGITFIEHSRPA